MKLYFKIIKVSNSLIIHSAHFSKSSSLRGLFGRSIDLQSTKGTNVFVPMKLPINETGNKIKSKKRLMRCHVD